MICKYQLFTMIILIVVTTTAWTQDKGGRWQFENNGFDTADWDNLDDSGNLQGTATYSGVDPANRDFNGRIDDVRISGSLENIIPIHLIPKQV